MTGKRPMQAMAPVICRQMLHGMRTGTTGRSASAVERACRDGEKMDVVWTLVYFFFQLLFTPRNEGQNFQANGLEEENSIDKSRPVPDSAQSGAHQSTAATRHTQPRDPWSAQEAPRDCTGG